jgi:5-methylcytosine-specific restriction protein A
MPIRAPSLRSCGCIVRSGALCQHAAARRAANDQNRPSARVRGYDTEYERAAAEFLQNRRTCACGRPATVVMHVISIRKRPDLRLDRTNWLPGCKSCNAKDAHRDRLEQSTDRGVSQTSPKGAGTAGGARFGTQRIFSSGDRDQNS